MDDSNLNDENTSVKYRIIGAIFWLGLLVVIVPTWYNDPVNFNPEQSALPSESQSVLMDKPFTLPPKTVKTDTSPTTATKAKLVDPAEENPVTTVLKKDVEPAQPKLEMQPKTEVKKEVAQTEPSNWVIQLVAYKTQTMAEGLKERLKYDYDAFVKFFPKNGYYSVRVGPYEDQALALKDQARLNQLLRIDSILIKGQFKKAKK